jgi:hypothetical protein
MGAARNRWMRGLREEYNLDERRKKNANKMTTAIQVGKSERDPESVKKKSARYTVSRKAEAPAGHVQARAAAAAATGANAVAVGRPPMSAPPRISAYGRGSPQGALGLNDVYLGRGYSDDDGSDHDGMEVDVDDVEMGDDDYDGGSAAIMGSPTVAVRRRSERRRA